MSETEMKKNGYLTNHREQHKVIQELEGSIDF